MQLYLLDVIERLRSERSFTLDQLSAERYRLRDAIIKRIGDCKRQAKAAGYQLALFSEAAPVEVGPQRVFTFDPNYYSVNSFYEGPFSFPNHYYRAVGAMNGEEARCAGLIDALPGVKWWVRNPDRGPQAFWLPTWTDKFYPDFIVLLKDGRTLVVEYKGSQLLGGPDARQKEAVGRLWEARSGDKCVFRLVSAEDYEAQLRAIVYCTSESLH
jgi:type III restriction enzyme